jgi:hypothetical protein
MRFIVEGNRSATAENPALRRYSIVALYIVGGAKEPGTMRIVGLLDMLKTWVYNFAAIGCDKSI